jgi:hypothetical protein
MLEGSNRLKKMMTSELASARHIPSAATFALPKRDCIAFVRRDNAASCGPT